MMKTHLLIIIVIDCYCRLSGKGLAWDPDFDVMKVMHEDDVMIGSSRMAAAR